MSGRLDLAGDTILRCGGQLSETAGSMADELAAFEGRLAALGDPFGDDDLGAAMGFVYGAVADAAMACYDENAAVVADTGGQLVEMGREYGRVEQANGAAFADVREGMG